MEPGIAHRPVGASETELFLLKGPPGYIDRTNAGVERCQSKCLGHTRRGGDPPPAGHGVVVSAEIGIGVSQHFKSGGEARIQLESVQGLLETRLELAALD